MINDNKVINKVHGFRFWCQKVIPLVFDDSLSYYEVLCKLTHLINEYGETINACIDGIVELQETMQDFMDDINETYNKIKDLIRELDGCYTLTVSVNELHELEEYELNSRERARLLDILNDMISKLTVKPIYLNFIDQRTTLEPNAEVKSFILYPTSDFINNVRLSQPADINMYSALLNIDEDYNIVSYYTLSIPSTSYTIGTNVINSISACYIQNNDYQIAGGGSGEGLPSLTLHNSSLVTNAGLLTNEEKSALETIINNMIDNETATPFVIKQEINQVGVYADEQSVVTVMNTNHSWIAGLLYGSTPNITFNGIGNIIDLYAGKDLHRSTIQINNTDYTVDSTTKHITLTGNIYYTCDFIAIYNEQYIENVVDTKIAGLTGLPIYELYISDINNMTQDDENRIVTMLNTIRSGNTNYIILLKSTNEVEYELLQCQNPNNQFDNTDGYHTLTYFSFLNNHDTDAGYYNKCRLYVEYYIQDGQLTLSSKQLTFSLFQGVGYWDVPNAVYDQVVKTTRYRAENTWTYDSSTTSTKIFNIHLDTNGLPTWPSWIPIHMKHLLFDETDQVWVDIDTDPSDPVLHFQVTSSSQYGELNGSYYVSSALTQLTNGHTYRDTVTITFQNIHNEETVSWLI